MNERRLAAWVQAGLIDNAAAGRIRAWEAQHSRPLALWAVVGIGALAIALGLISVVAANWDAIPAMVRLGLHLTLLVAAAGALAWTGTRALLVRSWVAEAVLFVFGALGLTFFGHLGQAYQTSSPLWQPLTAWLVLFGPLVMLRGSSWLTALALAGMLVFAVWGFAAEYETRGAPVLAFALPTALPVALAPLGAVLCDKGLRPAFWRRIEELGFAYGLGGASLITAFSGVEAFAKGDDAARTLTTFVVWAAAGLAAAGIVWAARTDRSGRAGAAVLAAAGAAVLLAYPLSGGTVIGAVLFMALWTTVAAMALRGGWRVLFQFAVAVLALRLIVLSFELEDDLLTSGAGLIASGVLILGIAWGAVRVAKRFAPPREAAP